MECPICYTIFDGFPIRLGCKHTFCKKCLKDWERSQLTPYNRITTCPLCREPITKRKQDWKLKAKIDFKTRTCYNSWCHELILKEKYSEHRRECRKLHNISLKTWIKEEVRRRWPEWLTLEVCFRLLLSILIVWEILQFARYLSQPRTSVLLESYLKKEMKRTNFHWNQHILICEEDRRKTVIESLQLGKKRRTQSKCLSTIVSLIEKGIGDENNKVSKCISLIHDRPTYSKEKVEDVDSFFDQYHPVSFRVIEESIWTLKVPFYLYDCHQIGCSQTNCVTQHHILEVFYNHRCVRDTLGIAFPLHDSVNYHW